MINNIWNLVGSDVLKLLTTIFSIVITIILANVKNVYQKKISDETKRNVIKTVVNAIEQIYKDMSGDEKLQKAKENIINILEEKNITISELEMNMMIEEICKSIKKVNILDE